jgi:hypothetical protein
MAVAANLGETPMATATRTRDQGKTAFLKEFLLDNPTANPTAANEAWVEAGMPGTVSASLVNKLRSKLKLTGNLRAGRKKRTGTPSVAPRMASATRSATPAAAHTTRASGRTLAEIEADLDRLIYRVMGIKGLDDVAEKLRATRRALYPHYTA